jgi:hypothetical protein
MTRSARDFVSALHAATECGRQRLPEATQGNAVLWPMVNESKVEGECIALKRSREPLVFIVFSGISVATKCCGLAGDAPKRLPSRRRVVEHAMMQAVIVAGSNQKKTRPALGRDGFSKYSAGPLS